MIQNIAVGLIVLLTLLLVIRSLLLSLKPKSGTHSGCGGCSGCDLKDLKSKCNTMSESRKGINNQAFNRKVTS
jgi:hypothetical protein